MNSLPCDFILYSFSKKEHCCLGVFNSSIHVFIMLHKQENYAKLWLDKLDHHLNFLFYK
jgi:hypothetical protein